MRTITAVIAKKTDAGYLAAYCRNLGSPSWTGRMLCCYFTLQPDVDRLIAAADIDRIGDNGIFYWISSSQPLQWPDLQHLQYAAYNHIGADYLYIWDGSMWSMCERTGTAWSEPRPITA